MDSLALWSTAKLIMRDMNVVELWECGRECSGLRSTVQRIVILASGRSNRKLEFVLPGESFLAVAIRE